MSFACDLTRDGTLEIIEITTGCGEKIDLDEVTRLVEAARLRRPVRVP